MKPISLQFSFCFCFLIFLFPAFMVFGPPFRNSTTEILIPTVAAKTSNLMNINLVKYSFNYKKKKISLEYHKTFWNFFFFIVFGQQKTVQSDGNQPRGVGKQAGDWLTQKVWFSQSKKNISSAVWTWVRESAAKNTLPTLLHKERWK